MCSYRDDTCKCRYVQVLLLYFLTLWRSLSPSLSNTSLSNTSLSNTRALISSFREICVRIDSLCIRCNMRVSTCGEGGGGCDDIFRILRNFLDSKISRLRLLFKCPFEILDPEIGTLCARRMTRSGEGKEGRESIQDYRGARGGGVSMKNLTKLTKLSDDGCSLRDKEEEIAERRGCLSRWPTESVVSRVDLFLEREIPRFGMQLPVLTLVYCRYHGTKREYVVLNSCKISHKWYVLIETIRISIDTFKSCFCFDDRCRHL